MGTAKEHVVDIAFAGHPSAFVFEAPEGERIDHLLWGDFVRLLGPRQGEWVNVRSRGKTGWMREEDIQTDRLLEVNFVDIGQGDGCFIVTPDDRFILIDAGQEDNMFRFLRWRFNLQNHKDHVVTIDDTIISHPDSDHYKGFTPLFASPQFKFKTVYHNGIVERAGDDRLGEVEEIGGRRYVTEVIRDLAALKAITGDEEKAKSLYSKLLKTGCESGRVEDIRMLCAEDGFVPGYGASGKLKIRVLGPVPDNIDGRRCLRWFKDEGKTKNGHSVVLKLEYGKVSVLLGGDLNVPAEEHLLAHYTGLDPSPNTAAEREALVAAARETFESDIAKACHHGSGDFSTIFLESVNPRATVVSSGDNESHAHPRPDALGAFGKAGRGDRPLIFSTELARSAKETIKEPNALRREVQELFSLREKAENEEVRVRLDAKVRKLLNKIDRTVSVYGLINLRTDGERVVLAQKLEKPAPRGEWDIHLL